MTEKSPNVSAIIIKGKSLNSSIKRKRNTGFFYIIRGKMLKIFTINELLKISHKNSIKM